MDRLAGMAMFLRVVEHGSFAGAAKASDVSPTMVAKHVTAIEKRLGARLLHRTTRRQQLTEVGQLYHERCRQALAEVELAEASAAELQTSPKGLLRLVAPVSFGSERLVPVLTELLDAHAGIKVELTLDNGARDLVDQGYELGIQIGDAAAGDLIARPLKPYRRILAASPAYLDRRGIPTMPEDLGGHDCLGLAYWQHHDRWHLTGPGGDIRRVPVSGRFTANLGAALRAAALNGAGILLQPEMLLEDDLTAGRLVRVLPDWSYRPSPMFLLYAQDRRPTAKLRAAIDLLLARFGP